MQWVLSKIYTHKQPFIIKMFFDTADRNAMSSRPQSATSTPKRQLSVKERSQRSAQNIFGEPGVGSSPNCSGGRRSPSNGSMVSVPMRRSATPLEYSDRAHSEKSANHKDHRFLNQMYS